MNSNEDKLIALLDDIILFEREHEIGEAFNIFEAVGMRTQEIRHSKFLAYILNPTAAHGFGAYFLRKFLEQVVTLAAKPPITRLEVILADLSSAQVYTERDYFDITVWLPYQKLLLVIENKTESSESVDQLSKYRRKAQEKYPKATFCGVFLTPDGYEGKDRHWVSVSYATIYEQLQALLHDPAVSMTTSVEVAIEHYSQLIRRYIVADEKLVEACRSIYAQHRMALDLIIRHGQASLVQEAAQRFLQQNSNLQLAKGSSHSRVNIVVSSWFLTKSFQVADSKQWWSTCPLLLWFQLDEKKSMLELVLEVGPVRAGAEISRQALVLKLRELFGISSSKLPTEIYTRITRYAMAVTTDDIDDIVNAMQNLWIEFSKSVPLQNIQNIIHELSCSGSNVDT